MAFTIPEAHVQHAFEVLQSKEHAAARAAFEFGEKQLKVVLAKAVLASGAKTVSERENEALASPEYERALMAHRLVSDTYFKARDRREAATALIDGWRTQQSDQRAMARIG